LVSGRVVRVSRKNTIYIPKDVAERVGIREGVLVEITVEGGRIILTPIPDPLWLALHGPKFAEISVKDVEKVSEEMQRGLADEDTP
jgi:antitoxin MazE